MSEEGWALVHAAGVVLAAFFAGANFESMLNRHDHRKWCGMFDRLFAIAERAKLEDDDGR